MTAHIIDGKKTASEIYKILRQKIKTLPSAPKLAIIMVGHDEGSVIYVRNKQKAAEDIGLKTELFHFSEDTTQDEIINLIARLNTDSQTNGIIVQLPLPQHLDTHKIIDHINPQKDVDGFNPYNTGMLQNNEQPYFIAATPLGIVTILENLFTDLSGKNVVIIGASLIVGRPLAALLLNRECTVTVTHIQTRDIKELTRKADILIAACGVAKLVKQDWIKNGAVLIDVGINRENGKICGDIDADDVQEIAAALTPVPGGVGPMTIAMLLQNTVNAYIMQHQ